ncbi:MAG: cell division protein FtsA [Candidatus Marinimicrobia bacterium]|nr:cell division protein FtsA [Candidatus Neomarinimicrobiota bacterium]
MARPKIIAGIDVGSAKVATVIGSVEEEEEKKIKIIGASSLPSKGIRKGQIVNIEEAAKAVVESVEAAERMAGYSLTRAVVAISGPHLASQNSRGVVAVAEPEGEINDDDVRRVIEAARAVSLPASREVIHVIPRYFTVDGQEGIKDPVGMSGVRLEVETHIITGSSTAMRNLTKCVSEVGADVQSLVASGLASAEATLTETEKELGVILVDIGGGVTDLVVFIEGSPSYTTVLPIGANNVTNDIAIGLRLSLESAEKIKIAFSEMALPKSKKKEEEKEKEDEDEVDLKEIGIIEEVKKVSRKTLTEGIIRPRLNEIMTMVGLELKKSGAIGLTPAGLVITGGGALTVGVKDAAKRNLAMPVRIGEPQGISGLADEVNKPDFATAVGLLHHGTKSEVRGISDFSLLKIGKKLEKVPLRGAIGKAVNLVKQFLP